MHVDLTLTGPKTRDVPSKPLWEGLDDLLIAANVPGDVRAAIFPLCPKVHLFNLYCGEKAYAPRQLFEELVGLGEEPLGVLAGISMMLAPPVTEAQIRENRYRGVWYEQGVSLRKYLSGVAGRDYSCKKKGQMELLVTGKIASL